jgi:hypothetical protein
MLQNLKDNLKQNKLKTEAGIEAGLIDVHAIGYEDNIHSTSYHSKHAYVYSVWKEKNRSEHIPTFRTMFQPFFNVLPPA